jgi:hypothetical protein
MIGLVHGAVGATCGSLLRRRGPTVAVAFLSHMVVDAIRHEEPLDERGRLRLGVLALDGVLLGLAWLVVRARHGAFSPQSLGAVVACLPDVDYFLLGSVVHKPFPHGRWPSRRMGVWWQFSIGVVAWLALLASGAVKLRSRACSRRLAAS